jgi:precorrin-3B C17-methyltransferase
MSGSLSIVGLGPGGPEHRTAAAERAVREADVVIGYGPYVDQCADLLHGQEVVRGRMGEELLRAEEAVSRARSGARVALVSSGDAGVHGMAARTLALVAGRHGGEAATDGDGGTAAAGGDGGTAAAGGGGGAGLRVEVIPGVTAALAVAARLGAPLADDWATLSLSDLHVPWATVERRLTVLATSGIALALYNPRSKTRTEPFARALEVLRSLRPPETPAVVATDVARPGETLLTTTLAALDPETVTMRSLVLIAGDTATWAGDHLIATRGAADIGYPKGSDPSTERGSA